MPVGILSLFTPIITQEKKFIILISNVIRLEEPASYCTAIKW